MNQNQYLAEAARQLAEHNITACYHCECRGFGKPMGHSRAHAHVEKRIVCLSAQPSGFQSFFTLLHEIGHIVEPGGNHKYRFMQEHHANQFAYRKMRELGIPLKRKIRKKYDDYVSRQVDRALRRGLKVLPPEIRRAY